MMKRYAFDGLAYADKRVTGMYRYVDELMSELDRISEKDAFELVVPNYVHSVDGRFKNIKVVHCGNVKGILWTQTCFAGYILRNNAVGVGLCNVTPLIKPGIATVHDIGYKVLTGQYKNIYGRLSKAWHRLNYWVIAREHMPVLTVSEFTKKQYSDVYGVDPERFRFVSCGWQHMLRVEEDDSIFAKHPELVPRGYYFALGSLEERKNFQWIVEVAKRNPEATFVIAGGSVRNNKKKIDFDAVPNVHFLGYVDDGAVKALMKSCKAFLFPSTFEGFGVPPMETLSVGSPVVISDIPPHREVYGGAAHYIDPYNYDVDLDELLREDVDPPETVLERYTWEKSALTLLHVLKDTLE